MQRGDGRLLEREKQLAAVDRLLDDLAAGRGGALALLAPAGMGKTAVVDAAVERARERRLAVVAGQGSRMGSDDTWGMARRILAPLTPNADLSPAADEALGVAEPGEGAGATAATPDQVARSVLRVTQRLTELVVAAAAREPLLVAVDDAHWSDQASLRWLAHLLERLPGASIGLVVAARPEARGEARTVLEQLTGHPALRALRLPGLTPFAISALLDDALDALPARDRGELAVEAAEVTAGNPFLIARLLDAAVAEVGAARPLTGRLAEVAAPALDAVVSVRLADAGATAAAVARTVAVLGGTATVRRVAVLGGLTETAVCDAVDVLARVGLLDGGEPLRFTHPLLAAAIYDALPPAAVADAHARAAALLAEDGVPAGAVAAHLLRAPRRADAATSRQLAEAARQALRAGEAPLAVRLLERALDEPPPPGARAALLVSLAQARAAAGDRAASATFTQALDQIDDPRRRAEVRREEGQWLFTTGRVREAARAYLVARAELGEVDPSDPLDQELRAAYLGVAHFDVELRPLVERELAMLLDEPGDGGSAPGRALLAQLAYRQTLAAAPIAQVRDLCDRAWSAGALLADEGAGGVTWTLVAGSLYWIGDLERALELTATARQAAERRGSPLARATAAWCGGPALLHRGEVETALAEAEVALTGRRVGWALHLGSLHRLHARCLIELGQLDAAEGTLTTALGIEALRHSSELASLLEARGRIRLLRADPEGALVDFEASRDWAQRGTFAELPSVLPWRSSTALALNELGEAERALALLEEEETLAERSGTDRCRSTVLRIRGRVLGGEAGIASLEAAVAAMASPQPRLERTYAQVDLGAALRRAGRRREAEGPLRDALLAAQAGGATILADRARDELAALGARARPAGGRGSDLLTPSERRVAELAAAGRSNKDIATTLVVSTKTVEYHLGQVYRKLRVNGRSGLAKTFNTRDG